MSRKRSLIAFALGLLAGALLLTGGIRSTAAQPSLADADRLYAERSYVKALEGYQRALELGLAGDRGGEIEYRIAVCLGRSDKWDQALEETRAFVKAHPDGLWAARGHYWLGQLLTVVPHQGYRVGERVYRGSDYPKLAGAEKPEPVGLWEEDADGAVASFEQAKATYESLARRAEGEEADLNFDLARALEARDLMPMLRALLALEKEKRPGLNLRFRAAEPKEVEKLRGHDWTPTPGKRYDSAQPLPQRILGLQQQIEDLDKGRRAPQARLARAMYVRQWQQQMRWQMRAYDEKSKEWIELPFPYQKLDPIALVQSIPDEFPKHAIAAQMQFTAGQWLEDKQDFVKALAAYQRVVSGWVDSKWATSARGRIQEIEWPSLLLRSTVARPGEKAELDLNGRNVKTVQLTAYRVRLDELLLRPKLLHHPRLGWSSLTDILASGRASWRSEAKQAASWSHVTQDTGEHKYLSEKAGAPLTDVGAYVVEAKCGEAYAAALLLLTDLALVEKTDKDRTLAFVCDAKSGRPVPGANVVFRETYWEGDIRRVSVARGQTDPEGLKSKPLVRDERKRNNQVAVLAWVGERYAVTGELWTPDPRYGNRDDYRAYTYTDRPVYRPGHKVYFRSIVTVRTVEGEDEAAGRYRPAKDVPLAVTVLDPRNEKVYEGTLTTNEFGSLNGSFALGEEATLGLYQMEVYKLPPQAIPPGALRIGGPRGTLLPPGATQVGRGSFRVEEYKKPEFEVTVTPSAEQLRLGERAQAKVKAWYYFGSPVVGAKVSYRVFRTPFYPRYHFPCRYDWLIRQWRGGEYRMDYHNGEVVKEGEGRTDAKGELTLELETKGDGQWPDALAYSYTIEAEVTDQSRRTITGSGEVRVSRQQFFAFLEVKRGFYQVADRIEVELATRDVMDRPVAARGQMRVERMVKGAHDIVEQLVHKEGIATDKEGRAFFRWTAKQAGQYRFVFEATDDWKQKVEGQAYTWVHGPDFDKAAFRLRGIQLVPDKQTYEEGETCRLLIVSNMPDTTVLLTQEAGGQILARAVLPLRGKSRVLEIRLNRGHMPNFQFHAVLVRDWQAYETQTEVFVPPGRQFLNVSVSSDQKEYRPGETATFQLKATDWRGKPVRAELSLGVVDASLFYIEKDLAGDPRLFFYGQRRYFNLGQNWSSQWWVNGISTTDRKREPYKEQEWVLPEDMGQLQDWPPDRVSLRPRYYGSWGYSRFKGTAVDDVRAGDVFYSPEQIGGIRARVAASPQLALAGGMMAGGAGAAAGPPPPAPPPALTEAKVRSEFADTAFWSPAIVTDKDGKATVTVTMPENLTTWQGLVRGLTEEVQVGEASAECVTRKNLIVRLQAPRFFMERDLVALSANVHNYLKSDKQVKVSLALGGGTLELLKDIPADLNLGNPATESSLWITVPSEEERRVDWVVRVARTGAASVRMTAQTDEESDAVELEFPALVHGVEKFEAQTGVIRDLEGRRTVTLKLEVPKERRRGATEVNLELTPSLAAIALDALPYLADYPYGCIEQTMSRFLPSALVARTLTDLGIDLEELGQRAKAYAKELEPSAGSQKQPDSAYTYPKGMPGSFDARELASRMYLRRAHSPIFNPAELKKMVDKGLRRIYSEQHADGGWGWWQSDISDPYMTAYVCYGLYTAREARWDIRDEVLEKGFQFLLKAIKEDDNLHRLAYLASVVTLRGPVDDAVKAIIADRLFRNRMKLTAYSQALLALALKQIGETDKARVVIENLENTAHVDRENGTCNWRPQERGWWWWHWWDNPVETNAAVLRAYLAVRPEGELAPMIVKWMVNNRRGNHWRSTKETALAVYALADYIRIKRELAPDYTITVDFGGKVQRSYRVNRQNALFFDNRFIVGDEVIGDGPQTLTIAVEGSGTLYYAAYLKYFSLEEDIKGGGNEIFARRRCFKLTPKLVQKKQDGRTWQELDYEREELASGARLRSGDLVEVELIIDAKNDYEYLVFEDMKPAGCEPVEVRSGPGGGVGVCSYLELRDEKVAFFISHMPQGTRALRYRLRAEIPGSFHALPTNGYSMYAPDVRCLSDEWRVTIGD
jgi:hypothetical protein